MRGAATRYDDGLATHTAIAFTLRGRISHNCTGCGTGCNVWSARAFESVGERSIASSGSSGSPVQPRSATGVWDDGVPASLCGADMAKPRHRGLRPAERWRRHGLGMNSLNEEP